MEQARRRELADGALHTGCRHRSSSVATPDKGSRVAHYQSPSLSPLDSSKAIVFQIHPPEISSLCSIGLLSELYSCSSYFYKCQRSVPNKKDDDIVIGMINVKWLFIVFGQIPLLLLKDKQW